MSYRFTGRHMTAILIAFFAIVIAVNVGMARLASSTFGGALAENGYVASQDYNHWIAEAAAQGRLGWSAKPHIEDGIFVLDVAGAAHPAAEVRLEHPLGRVAGMDLRMIQMSPSRLVSAQHVPSGRWEAHIRLRSGGHEARYLDEVHG